MNQLRLIHPIYLDVPMLVSFAAALQGGLSFGADVVLEKGHIESEAARVSGKLGLSKLFSSLFAASVSAEMSESAEARDVEVRKESKAHTEASIAIVLYDQLSRSKGYLFQPADAAGFASLEPGTLVEVSGTMVKNAVDIVIDQIDAISLMSGIKKQDEGQKVKGGLKGSREPAIAGDQGLVRLREVLSRDRQRTPISNVLLKCSQPADVTAVVTLRTQNLRDLTLSELHKNSVRVVGKVTRVLGPGERMSAFENYGMALLKPKALEELFQKLAANQALALEFSEIFVEGPAVQILPLMVFV